MNYRYHLIPLMLAGLCLAGTALPAAGEPSVPLKEEEVTPQKIKGFFDAAFMKSDTEKDGDLKVDDAGFKIFVRVDKEKKLLTFFSVWAMKASVAEAKKLKAINKLNDELIFVRFSLSDPTSLWCDYQLLYEGGVTPFAIINNYRLFARVVKGIGGREELKDMIGVD